MCELNEGGEKVLLVKPETFMNLSGRGVRQMVDFYQLPLADLLVVCDDIALPLGKLRVRAKGTHGGHNGLRDIQNHLGTTEYARLRIGVGCAPGRGGRSRAGPVQAVGTAGDRGRGALAAQAVIVWVHQGIGACMNQFNGGGSKSTE